MTDNPQADLVNVDFWAGRIAALIKLAEHYGMTVEITGGELVVSRQVSDVFIAQTEVQWRVAPSADDPTDRAALVEGPQTVSDNANEPAAVPSAPAVRAAIIAEILPDWEAVYEPGNVSDYLIGYANDEAPAKAAAEAWMRSQAEVTGRLEWAPDEQLATGRYDRWFELIERHDDGIDTGPGLIVRRRTEKPTT